MVAQPVEEHRLGSLLAQLHAALVAIPLAAYADQTSAEARQTAARLRALESMLRTHVGAAVRAVDRLVPTRQASQLLAGDFGLDAAAAHREIREARALASSGEAERAAAAGRISQRHAVVIGTALRELPEATTAEQRALAENHLIAEAGRVSPRDLATRARRISELFTEADAVDAHENELLERREARARERVSLAMWDAGDGTWQGRFVLPEVQARMLKTVIDAFAAPRRSSSNGSRAGRPGAARPQGEDDRPYDRRAGEALLALIEHLPADGLPTTGGTPARIVVMIEEAKLRERVGAATLTTGERISAGQLRRLACLHGILPAVLGGASIPVDLGRSQRLFSTVQRDALATMDGGCVAPGCDRPPAWCEAHHGGRPWAAGGRTDLAQGYLLCSAHHHEAHRQNWQFRRAPSGFAEVDRGHGWQRNHRYRP